MKGAGFHGLRGKQLSLILIALICTTILLWAWEKTPLVTTLIPPPNLFEIHASGTLVGGPTTRLVSIKQEYIEGDTSDAAEVGESKAEQAEQSFDVAQIGSTITSFLEKEKRIQI